MAKKSWNEKLHDSKGLPRIERFEQNKPKTWPAGLYLIPAPLMVDAVMKKIPKGKLTTINAIREHLARLHQTEYTCPITTGIFSWIAAHAANEQIHSGKKRVTPWWRTLKAKGQLNPKYPGGAEEQKTRLEAEGHTVLQKGKHFYVLDYEKNLAALP